MSEKLLIVEDDKKLNDGIRLALKNDAYFFYQCRTLQEAREILKKEDITLVLLDVNLPDGNGIDFVREIRKNSQVPIILLTVNNMEVDIVTGLEAGANDYITKPFSLMVLRARVSVQLRNKEAAAKNSMELDGFEFYFDKMEFFKDGEPIELSKTDQKLLRVLCENRGKVLKREYLIDEVWQGDTEFVDAHALTVAVKRLRDKLEDDTQKPEYVKTVYGNWLYMGGEWMIEIIMLIVVIFVLSGVFWYSFFYQKEKKLFNRLQRMLDCAIDGELERTEISEEKYSALENSMKQHLDSSFLARKNQQEQKEVIQKLISDIAHQTLTPISNLKIYGEILSETNHENQEEIATILEQTEKLDFLIQSLVKLSRMESGIIAVHPEDTTIAQMFASVQQQFNVKVREKNITLSLCDTDLHVLCDPKWTVEAIGNIVDNAIKYTACGGNVQIKVEQYSFFVKIDIIDDGIGIEKEEIPKIFGRFYRSLSVADQPGVGIGLFLAREIIQAQKGYIKVTSKRGKGSTFSVFLPIAKKE